MNNGDSWPQESLSHKHFVLAGGARVTGGSFRYVYDKRFELTGQSTVLISDALGDPSVDPENFGNR